MFVRVGCEKGGENVCTGRVAKSDVGPATAPEVRPTPTNISEVDPYQHPLFWCPDFDPKMFVRVNDFE